MHYINLYYKLINKFFSIYISLHGTMKQIIKININKQKKIMR